MSNWQYRQAQGHKLLAKGLTLLEFTLCGIWSTRLPTGNTIAYDTPLRALSALGLERRQSSSVLSPYG